MNSELATLNRRLSTINTPEEFFGKLSGGDKAGKLRAGLSLYRKYAKVLHEDVHVEADKPTARVCFEKLGDLWKQAQTKIEAGVYGKRIQLATIKSKKRTYSITAPLAGGDVTSLYRATDGRREFILKISRDARLNDLVENEAKVLLQLAEATKDTTSAKLYFPELVETLRIAPSTPADIRAVNVLGWRPDYVTLHDVVAHYPEGVDPRHGVWIFNRLTTALCLAQSQDVVHGSVLPPHILVSPSNHAVMLVDWCYAVPTRHCISAIADAYKSWYPPEVLARRPATVATDLFMAAQSTIYALGGDFGVVPPTVPAKMARFLESCLVPNPARRPTDAYALHDSFRDLALEVFGKRKFVPLELSVTEGV